MSYRSLHFKWLPKKLFGVGFCVGYLSIVDCFNLKTKKEVLNKNVELRNNEKMVSFVWVGMVEYSDFLKRCV